MDVTFDNLSCGVWDEQEARGYLGLLLQAVAHAKQVRAMFMDVLLTHETCVRSTRRASTSPTWRTR